MRSVKKNNFNIFILIVLFLVVAIFIITKLQESHLDVESNKDASQFSNQKITLSNSYEVLITNLKSKYSFVDDSVNGFIRVSKFDSVNGETCWGFVNLDGKEICEIKYADSQNFSEGFAAVAIGEYEDLKWGFINHSGKVVISLQYDEVGNFYDGRAVIYNRGDGNNPFFEKVVGYINTNGDLIIPANFDRIVPNDVDDFRGYSKLSSFHNGIAFVLTGGKYGVIDRQGTYIVKPIYEDISFGDWNSTYRFSDGLLAVKIDGKWGFINEKFQLAIKPIFAEVSDFHSGYSIVKTGAKIFNTDAYYLYGGKCGVIDTKGDTLIPLQYTAIDGYENKKAKVYLGGKQTADLELEGGSWILVDKENNYYDLSHNYLEKLDKFGWIYYSSCEDLRISYKNLETGRSKNEYDGSILKFAKSIMRVDFIKGAVVDGHNYNTLIEGIGMTNDGIVISNYQKFFQNGILVYENNKTNMNKIYDLNFTCNPYRILFEFYMKYL